MAVRARNYRFFIAFLVSTVLLDGLVFALSVVHLVGLTNDRGQAKRCLRVKRPIAEPLLMLFAL